jgi:hypothetical protein
MEREITVHGEFVGETGINTGGYSPTRRREDETKVM